MNIQYVLSKYVLTKYVSEGSELYPLQQSTLSLQMAPGVSLRRMQGCADFPFFSFSKKKIKKTFFVDFKQLLSVHQFANFS